MRKKDREITDINEIIKIIKKCKICRLAFFDENYPYIIPLNFGYDYNSKNSKLDLYFHGAKEGKKLDLIRKNNNVAFEMDCSTNLIKGKKPCNYTMEFESLCGNGKLEILKNTDKIHGLKFIMNQYSDKTHVNADFNEKIVESTAVFKLKVNEITGKKLKK